MFCSKCGKQMEDDAKFCPGCGATVEGGGNSSTVTTESVSTIKAKSFVCDGCGMSLKIPDNARGKITCPSCKKECIIDGIVKNAEMAAKENISSGIPLTTPPSELHRMLVNCIFDNPDIPLDIFEKTEVTREDHYCVAAYYFYCNGMLIASAFTVLFGVLLPFTIKKGKIYNKQRAEAKDDLRDFEAQVPNMINKFKSEKKALRGIYEKVSGDEKAF